VRKKGWEKGGSLTKERKKSKGGDFLPFGQELKIGAESGRGKKEKGERFLAVWGGGRTRGQSRIKKTKGGDPGFASFNHPLPEKRGALCFILPRRIRQESPKRQKGRKGGRERWQNRTLLIKKRK